MRPIHKLATATRNIITHAYVINNILKLLKWDCKKSIRANVLGFRTVNFWNSLPEDVVNASSVNAFKGLFDSHCVQKRFNSTQLN